MKFNIQLGAGAVACAVCFLISYIAFQDGQSGLGLLFLLVGVGIVGLALAFGRKSE